MHVQGASLVRQQELLQVQGLGRRRSERQPRRQSYRGLGADVPTGLPSSPQTRVGETCRLHLRLEHTSDTRAPGFSSHTFTPKQSRASSGKPAQKQTGLLSKSMSSHPEKHLTSVLLRAQFPDPY